MSLTIIEESMSGLVRARDEDGNEFWIPREKLNRLNGNNTKGKELSNYCTDFESHKELFSAPFDENRNPEKLREFEKQVSTWVLVIGSAPSCYEQTLEEMRVHGVDDPENYVRLYRRGHDAKYDLLVPDPKIPNIDFDLGIFFGYTRLKSSRRYQIGRTAFALRHITDVRILEIGESLPHAEDLL